MGTLTAFYDLKVGPVSFDAAVFAVQARMAANTAACNRLHVVVVPDENGVDGLFRDKLHLYDAAEMHWRLWHLVVPALRMIGATVTVAGSRADAWAMAPQADKVWPQDWNSQSLKNRHHLQRPIVEAVKAGAALPRFRPLGAAIRAVRDMVKRDGRPLVTLTMRNTYEPARNADVSRWLQFRYVLLRQFNVVGVYDTRDEMSEGRGYGGLNLDLRAALYMEAVQNFHCNGGPGYFNAYLNAPFVVLGAARPLDVYGATWRDDVGLALGEQFPWSNEHQRLRYEQPDDALFEDERQRLVARFS